MLLRSFLYAIHLAVPPQVRQCDNLVVQKSNITLAMKIYAFFSPPE